LRSIADLPPAQISKVESAITTARRRAEAAVEIDAIGEVRPCPRCGGHHRISWGTTRSGARRLRCKDCELTWTGRTGTPLAGIRRPDLFIELLRNMFEGESPWSCRKAATKLGISRDTAWRWRIAVIGLLSPEKPGALAGIVEADEARQRESRKGSREWSRHRADPLAVAKPPREPWVFYTKRNATIKAPPGGWQAWNKNLLAITDRAGHRAFEAIDNVGEKAVSTALLPTMAPDAVLCTDGHATYKGIAKATGITHFALNAGRRCRRTPKTHHINTVNSLIGRYRAFVKPFCGPASRYLLAYGRWHAARENTDRNYLSIFKRFLEQPHSANTLC